LDDAAIAAHLSRLLGGDHPVAIDGLRRVAAHYRPGEQLRVLYEVTVEGETHRVAGTTFSDHAQCEHAFRSSAGGAVQAGSLPGVVRDDLLDTVFWVFPNDRRINALNLLAGSSELLSTMVGRPVTPRLISYVPERAATAACVDARGDVVAFAKVYGQGQ